MSYKIHNLDYLKVESIDADKIQQLEETAEILKEQIESLKLMLCYKSHELEEMQEELNYTNHELSVLNELYATSSEPQCTLDNRCCHDAGLCDQPQKLQLLLPQPQPMTGQ